MKGCSLIIRYLLIFILMVSIVAFAFINISSSTILSKDYVLSKLQETNYYEGIYKEILSNFENYVGQSGLDESVMSDILTQEKVKDDVNVMIDNIYEGADKEIDVTEIRDRLNENIKEKMEEEGVKAADDTAIETYINRICDEYTKTMTHTEYEQNINNVFMKILKFSQIGRKALLITMLVCIIFIFVICYKRLFKGISSIGISLLSSGIFYIFINIYINTKIKIDAITVLNSSISNTLRTIMNNIMSNVANYGYILFAIGIVLIIFGNLIDSIKYKKEEED